MNPRTYLVTAGAVLALAGPAVHVAGATIPADEWAGSTPTATVSASHQVRGGALHGSSTAIHVGAYNAHAYVHGGATAKVAKAITKAGKKTAAASRRTPRASTSAPEPCTDRDACTALQQCELHAFGCDSGLAERPDGGLAPSSVDAVADRSVVDASALLTTTDDVPVASGSAEAVATSDDLDEGC